MLSTSHLDMQMIVVLPAVGALPAKARGWSQNRLKIVTERQRNEVTYRRRV